jgi:hypothetical protein
MLALLSLPDWDWVAVGTFLLALATFYLAITNREIVTTSQRQLETAQEDLALSRGQNETAREALEAQVAPLLANVPLGLDPERNLAGIRVSHGTVGNEERAFISVPYRNVGNGVATVTSVQLMIGGHLFPAAPRSPILPAGESSRAEVNAGRADLIFDHALSLAIDGQDFAIVVGYVGAGEKSRGALRLDLHRESPRNDRWRVRQLHHGATPEAALSNPSLSSLPL